MKSVATTTETAQYIVQLESQIIELQQQLDWLKRQLFGRKSEKQLDIHPNQAQLFNPVKIPEQEEQSTPVNAHQRKKKHTQAEQLTNSGLRFDDSVPTQVIEVPCPELDGEYADEYTIIDYKETHRLAQRPGSYVVLIYRKPILKHKITLAITSSSVPETVFPGSYADVSILAGLMVDKAIYHLPLYRQHQRMQDSGIQLGRGTLTHWMQNAIELLRPVYQAQWQHCLLSRTLAMDEVPIKAGRKGKGKMNQSYFWPMYGEDDEVVFTWSNSRGMAHAKAQLKDFIGILLTDGYAAYSRTVEHLNQTGQTIVHATCWAHTRRKFEQALTYETEAQRALDFIAALYRHERHIKEQNLDEATTLDYRQQHSEPIINQFFIWLQGQRQRPDLLPSNPLSRAIHYTHERQKELMVFLANPNVPIDTNHLERALRVIPMGRKNYLFCWSELGAEQLGILQSLMVTCRLHKVNPYTYLVDVLQRVSLHPAKDVIDLTPRVWKTKFKENFLTSDLE